MIRGRRVGLHQRWSDGRCGGGGTDLIGHVLDTGDRPDDIVEHHPPSVYVVDARHTGANDLDWNGGGAEDGEVRVEQDPDEHIERILVRLKAANEAELTRRISRREPPGLHLVADIVLADRVEPDR